MTDPIAARLAKIEADMREHYGDAIMRTDRITGIGFADRLREALRAYDAAQADDAAKECTCPQHGSWIAAEDVHSMAREIDVALNGEAGAAKAPMLCDVVHQVLERITHPVARAVPWQPIESAPKDGKHVIVAYQNSFGKWRRVIAFYVQEGTLEANDDMEEEYAPPGWYEYGDVAEAYYFTDCPPTHWMPLPAPPTAAPEEK